jgi:hypothetical protein
MYIYFASICCLFVYFVSYPSQRWIELKWETAGTARMPRNCDHSSWAKFQPELGNPPKEPGRLYHQAAFSHVFEKYWDYLNAPLTYPDCSESNCTNAAMSELSSALSQMNLSSFEPRVDAEAKQSSLDIAQEAALSRGCIVEDAADYWGLDRSSPVTGSGGPAPV